jgi:uncharacterized iron-regulated membrane protein
MKVIFILRPMRTPRPFFGFLHRWVGLLIAGFLFLSGLTGAIISWDHELDELLNPHLTEARAEGLALPSLDLARQIEARHPSVKVSYVPLAAEQGHSLSFGVDPRIDPNTREPFDAAFNEVFVDPADGAELGKREWGAVWPITRETLVSFLYRLHYSMHLPDPWGLWVLGVVALLWTADCFVGFYLTLPARSAAKPKADEALALDESTGTVGTARPFFERWKPAWKVRWWGGSYRVNFDLHRAAGLWTWALLFAIAFTGVSMNLYRELFFPAMSLVSNVTPSPYDEREPADPNHPIEPRLDFEAVLPIATAEAKRRGWEAPAGSLYYSGEYGLYSVSFFRPEDGHGAGGVGHRRLYIDGLDGRLLGEEEPWRGTAADIFVQAQFPIHSGRILGLPGRILISLMGIVVAGLSVTGVVVWWRKQSARAASERRVSLRQPAGAN